MIKDEDWRWHMRHDEYTIALKYGYKGDYIEWLEDEVRTASRIASLCLWSIALLVPLAIVGWMRGTQ
jgi:hypothetical protein